MPYPHALPSIHQPQTILSHLKALTALVSKDKGLEHATCGMTCVGYVMCGIASHTGDTRARQSKTGKRKNREAAA